MEKALESANASAILTRAIAIHFSYTHSVKLERIQVTSLELIQVTIMLL